jgi:hypothetical protein
MSDTIVRNFGWRRDPVAVAQVKEAMQNTGHRLTFAQAAPKLIGIGSGQTAILHNYSKVVLGGFLQPQFQPRGTCVSRGHKRALDLLQCVEIATMRLSYEFNYISHAGIYGACRMHGNYLSNQDGAVGAWAAWAIVNNGVVLNKDVNDDDNKDDLAVQWGSKGVPADILAKMKSHLCTTFTQAMSANDVRDALVAGKSVTVSSDVGFEPFHRNAEGLCKPGGSWPHCMCVTGYRADKNWFLIDQSWGPDQPNGPIGDMDIPSYSFWIEANVMDRMVKQGDTWILTGLNGWDSDTMHWNV